MSVLGTRRYREGSRVRCGGACGLGGGALIAVWARARVQGEASVYEDPFTRSRCSRIRRSDALECRKCASRKFTGAPRGRLLSWLLLVKAIRSRARVQGEASVYEVRFTNLRF